MNRRRTSMNYRVWSILLAGVVNSVLAAANLDDILFLELIGAHKPLCQLADIFLEGRRIIEGVVVLRVVRYPFGVKGGIKNVGAAVAKNQVYIAAFGPQGLFPGLPENIAKHRNTLNVNKLCGCNRIANRAGRMDGSIWLRFHFILRKPVVLIQGHQRRRQAQLIQFSLDLLTINTIHDDDDVGPQLL